MATHTVGGHAINPAYTTPYNGAALDATVVKDNFNNTRGIYNAHDADATMHVQSSDIAARGSATTDGRFWVATTTVGTTSPAAVAVMAFDNGSTWLRETTFATTNGQPGIYDVTNAGTGSVTIDWNNGPIQRLPLNSGSCNVSFNNPIAGSTYTIILVQDATGGRPVTLNGWDFGDNSPSFNTGSGRKNVVSALYDGTEYLAAFSVKGATA